MTANSNIRRIFITVEGVELIMNKGVTFAGLSTQEARYNRHANQCLSSQRVEGG